MGFPGAEAVWSSVASGAIYPGADSSGPGMWSAIGIIACVVILVMGQMSEAAKLKNAG